ncbi:hypothetical protein [Deinococcus sp.]|uniref:hypothetical protein n=1 Tax=Deinococcus sp. TaxID=47478 RepID=UPI003C7A4462
MTGQQPDDRATASASPPDPRRLTAHFPEHAWPGRIVALEGGRGQMRLYLEGGPPWPLVGAEGDLEMHDGARFGVVVTETLAMREGGAEFRMKLIDRSR